MNLIFFPCPHILWFKIEVNFFFDSFSVKLLIVSNFVSSLLRRRFGKMLPTSRYVPDKHCAFVNYATAEAAANALRKFQRAEVDGKVLTLRFQPPGGARKGPTISAT